MIYPCLKGYYHFNRLPNIRVFAIGNAKASADFIKSLQ